MSKIIVSIFLLSLLFFSSCQKEEILEKSSKEESVAESTNEAISYKVDPKGSCWDCQEFLTSCVIHVRNCYAPWLPHGLTSINDKNRAINRTTNNIPQAGWVGVCKSDTELGKLYGHIFYICKVQCLVQGSKNPENYIITTQETSNGKHISRSGRPSTLRVLGYIAK